ncbi:MAG: hypothetical protein ACI30N_03250 [Muribaculaceae bacterium]
MLRKTSVIILKSVGTLAFAYWAFLMSVLTAYGFLASSPDVSVQSMLLERIIPKTVAIIVLLYIIRLIWFPKQYGNNSRDPSVIAMKAIGTLILAYSALMTSFIAVSDYYKYYYILSPGLSFGNVLDELIIPNSIAIISMIFLIWRFWTPGKHNANAQRNLQKDL